MRPPTPVAWGLLLAIAAAKVVVHLFAITRYGYFRDELYYLASTEHLAWGYVDHPPLSIAVLAVVRALAGDSLVALRSVPLACGVGLVLITGMLAARLGGGRAAQGLAALAVAVAPVYLAIHHYYSMNAIDQLLWVLAALLLVRLEPQAPAARWLPLGLVLGLGLLNKLSVLWLGAGLAAALLLTGYRRALRRPGPWLAAAVAFACLAPYVAWQIANGWPTREFVRNATMEKMVGLSPGAFLTQVALDMGPLAAVMAVVGLVWSLRGRGGVPARALAVIALVVLAILLANPGSRPSYITTAHPFLLAPGAVALASLHGRSGATLRALLAAGLLVYGAVAAPLGLPLLPPEGVVRYARALGVAPGGQERTRPAELPQQFADMFGWEEMAAKVARAHRSLPAAERARCAVFGQDYGQAGALDVLGRPLGLPPALSGHNSYWLWGPRGADGSCVIVLGDDRETLESIFTSVEHVDTVVCRLCMPYERDLPVWIARGAKVPMRELWPRVKKYR